MALIFREAHAAPDKKQLNHEYFILENAGATAVSTARLQVIRGREGKRGSLLGVIDPGFMLQPGEKILVVSGMPGKKAHGDAPEREGMRTYHLLQQSALLTGGGTIIKLTLNQIEVAKLIYDPEQKNGVAPAAVPGTATGTAAATAKS
jgi:hypothetical protein